MNVMAWVGLVGASLLAACAMESPAPGAKRVARGDPLTVTSACSAHVAEITVAPRLSDSSGELRLTPGTGVVDSTGGGVRWKLTGNRYAFTSDGVAFKPNQPAGPVYAPQTGDAGVYVWCFGDTSARDLTWEYTIKFTAPDGKVWSCDPTIVNRGGGLSTQAPLSVPCVLVAA